MKTSFGLFALISLILTLLGFQAKAQNLPGSLSFSVSGAFENGVAQGSTSLLMADNDLTDGYTSGMDLNDAPASLSNGGPAGSAAFQWGNAATSSSYPHSSALWFQPITGNSIIPGESFNIGSLFYRNGTIVSGSGASAVDLALTLNFSSPSGITPMTTVFTSDLINSPNTSDPVASADIVSLRNTVAPLNFSDAAGNQYYLELSFKVDQTTIDGTLSTPDEFRVFEGGQGRADLLGRFTTCSVPEPSTALLSVLGALALFRRKR